MIKKYRSSSILLTIALVITILGGGCGRSAPSSNQSDATRDSRAVDFSGLTFSPWDVEAAAASLNWRETAPKAYTIMIYMNGSDLESESGAATADILEMLNSGVNTELVNVVLFTGGTYRWQNAVVPSNDCIIWQIEDGRINKIAGVGLVNMGDPGTLSSFINFGMRYFPADKYGLIFWDHGGGSIAGYGHDELFNDSSLTLLKMNYAFEMSDAANSKLEFLGFDACLMATVEMAVVASDYADYLVASEDLEPGDGWNYSFLSVLNRNPEISGDTLGRAITDYYMLYFGNDTDNNLTLSVTDLKSAGRVMASMGNLMNQCSQSLIASREASFITFAKRRGRTKAFGSGSQLDYISDMVDIADMAANLSDLFPNETADILEALQNAVVYNRHNSATDLGGLTAYYIFGGKNNAKNTLSTYAALNMDQQYTDYLYTFAGIMNGTKIQNRISGSGTTGGDTADETSNLLGAYLTIWQMAPGRQDLYLMTGMRNAAEITGAPIGGDLWPAIDGNFVCPDKTGESNGGTEYAVPVCINGRDSDIIILFSEKYPKGKIMGSRQTEGYIIQKGLDEIKDGDKISFYYRAKSFDSSGSAQDEWYKSKEITVKDGLSLDWQEMDNPYYYSYLYIDIQQNETYTNLTPGNIESRSSQ